MTSRAASQVAYLAGLASRAASAQPPLRLQPTQAPQSLQPPRPLFAGPAYGLDSPRDSGLDRVLDPGLDPAPSPGDEVRDQDGLAGTSGSETAQTAPTRWAGFRRAEAAGPSPAARPGTRAHGGTAAAEASAPDAGQREQPGARPASVGRARPGTEPCADEEACGPGGAAGRDECLRDGPFLAGFSPVGNSPDQRSADGGGRPGKRQGRGSCPSHDRGGHGRAGQPVRTGRGHWPGPRGPAARPRLAVGGASGTARRAPRARADRTQTGGGWRNGP